MNGPSVISKNYLATVGLDWKIAGIGDCNGDGTSDILWQNSWDGTVVAWLMNGFAESGARDCSPPSRYWAKSRLATTSWPERYECGKIDDESGGYFGPGSTRGSED
jgi:hypothetical protein